MKSECIWWSSRKDDPSKVETDTLSHFDGFARIALSRPARPFEFPNGYNDMFGVERYRASEVVFSPILWEGVSGVVS